MGPDYEHITYMELSDVEKMVTFGKIPLGETKVFDRNNSNQNSMNQSRRAQSIKANKNRSDTGVLRA